MGYAFERNILGFAKLGLHYSEGSYVKLSGIHDIVANRKLASTNKPVAFRSVHTVIEPPFLLKIYHCWRDSELFIQKILTKREMINSPKFNFLLFLTINSVTTAVRELNGTSQISLVTHDAKKKKTGALLSSQIDNRYPLFYHWLWLVYWLTNEMTCYISSLAWVVNCWTVTIFC